MKKVMQVLLKILGAVLILTGLGCIIMSVPIVMHITRAIADMNIANAAISTLILIFVWAIGFMMAMFGLITLKKDFVDVFEK